MIKICVHDSLSTLTTAGAIQFSLTHLPPPPVCPLDNPAQQHSSVVAAVLGLKQRPWAFSSLIQPPPDLHFSPNTISKESSLKHHAMTGQPSATHYAASTPLTFTIFLSLMSYAQPDIIWDSHWPQQAFFTPPFVLRSKLCVLFLWCLGMAHSGVAFHKARPRAPWQQARRGTLTGSWVMQLDFSLFFSLKGLFIHVASSVLCWSCLDSSKMFQNKKTKEVQLTWLNFQTILPVWLRIFIDIMKEVEGRQQRSPKGRNI